MGRSTAAGPSRLGHTPSRAGDDSRTEVSMSQPKIVVGYVKSEEGKRALDQAIKEAKIRNAKLVLIHSERGGRGESVDEIIEYREAGEEIESRLRQEGLEFVLRGLVRGNTPAQDLAQAAEEEGSDLIVIGVRNRSALGKLLLGSNAQEIIMSAPCPVLCIRAS